MNITNNFLSALTKGSKDFLDIKDLVNCLSLNKELYHLIKKEMSSYIFSRVSHKFAILKCFYIKTILKEKLETIEILSSYLDLCEPGYPMSRSLEDKFFNVIYLYNFALSNINIIKNNIPYFKDILDMLINDLPTYRKLDGILTDKKYDFFKL